MQLSLSLSFSLYTGIILSKYFRNFLLIFSSPLLYQCCFCTILHPVILLVFCKKCQIKYIFSFQINFAVLLFGWWVLAVLGKLVWWDWRRIFVMICIIFSKLGTYPSYTKLIAQMLDVTHAANGILRYLKNRWALTEPSREKSCNRLSWHPITMLVLATFC